MSTTAAPFGLRVVHGTTGEARMENQVDGIASGYATSLFTGTPIKRHTDGTIIATATGADSIIGIFKGCQYTRADGTRKILPYWPASETYVAGSMIAQWEALDGNIILEAQADGAVPMTEVGEGINLANTSQGSTYTGLSTQALSATTTGATPGTFTVVGLAQYPDNEWNDTYTIVRVKPTMQGPVA